MFFAPKFIPELQGAMEWLNKWPPKTWSVEINFWRLVAPSKFTLIFTSAGRRP